MVGMGAGVYGEKVVCKAYFASSAGLLPFSSWKRLRVHLARQDEAADDNVLLETDEHIDALGGGRVDEHADHLLEGSAGEPGIGSKSHAVIPRSSCS